MNATLSVNEIVQLFLAFCAGVSVVGGTLTYIARLLGWLKKPEETQNSRLSILESEVADLKKKTDSDWKAINELQESNKLLLSAMLATVKHELDGNDVHGLQDVQRSLEQYLINK